METRFFAKNLVSGHLHPDHPPTLDQQPLHGRAGSQGHAPVANPPHQRIHHVLGLPAGRKDPPPALGHGADSPFFTKSHQVSVEELVKGLAEKTPVGPEVGDELGYWSDVGQVAASLASDAQLAPWAIHLLEKQRFGPQFGGLPCGHQAGCASPDHDHPTLRHTPLTASVMRATRTISRTSWTRTMLAPWAMARATVAAVPSSR